MLFLFVAVAYLLIKRVKIESNLFKLSVVIFIAFLAYEILFFYAPLDPSYLLVILPFSFIIVGILFQNDRKTLTALLLLVFISNFIVVNLAKPDVENFATKANYGLWLEPGYLVETTKERMKVMECTDQSCYENKTQN